VQSASAREAEATTLEFVRNDEPTIDGRFTEAGKSDYRSRSACGHALTPPSASGGRPAQYNRIHLARDELAMATIQVRQQLAALNDHLAARLSSPSIPRPAIPPMGCSR
jgi:hypothetical protein